MQLPLRLTENAFGVIERALIVAVAMLAGAAFFAHCSGDPQPQLAIAHARSEQSRAVAAQADTVFRTDTLRVAAARADYRQVRDSVRQRVTDTSLVKQALAKADTVIAEDSVAIAAAGAAITAHVAHEADLRAELEVAQRVFKPPRLRRAISVLYDPLTQTPAGSGDVSFRLIGNIAALARCEQRFAPGERPRCSLGASVTF